MQTGIFRISFITLLVLSLVITTSGWVRHSCNTCPVCSVKSKKNVDSCCSSEKEKSDCCSKTEKSKTQKKHTSNCTCCFLKAMPHRERKAVVTNVKLPSDSFTVCIIKPVNNHLNSFLSLQRSAFSYLHYDDDLSNAPPMVPLLI